MTARKKLKRTANLFKNTGDGDSHFIYRRELETDEDENFKNAVDYMFDALEKEKSNHFAVKQYRLSCKIRDGLLNCFLIKIVV